MQHSDGSPDKPNRTPADRQQTKPPPDWQERIEVLKERARLHRVDPAYDCLSAETWYKIVGHVSNRVDDMAAYLDQVDSAVADLRMASQGNVRGGSQSSLVEDVATYLADVRGATAALQAIRDAMYKELQWYEDELLDGLVPTK